VTDRVLLETVLPPVAERRLVLQRDRQSLRCRSLILRIGGDFIKKNVCWILLNKLDEKERKLCLEKVDLKMQ